MFGIASPFALASAFPKRINRSWVCSQTNESNDVVIDPAHLGAAWGAAGCAAPRREPPAIGRLLSVQLFNT
ncbi:MAG: hypothetical protein ABWZ98_08510, partial [Nakamurella sp.]